jgi:hypothetical protein
MVAYYMDNCGNSTGFSTMTESDDFERLLATTLGDFSGCRFIGAECTKATTLNDFWQRVWTSF